MHNPVSPQPHLNPLNHDVDSCVGDRIYVGLPLRIAGELQHNANQLYELVGGVVNWSVE